MSFVVGSLGSGVVEIWLLVSCFALAWRSFRQVAVVFSLLRLPSACDSFFYFDLGLLQLLLF